MKCFQKSRLLFMPLLVIIGAAANHCTNETNPKILPIKEEYKPDHTIEFSHEIHGQIDCKYCHNKKIDEKGGIPITHICVNCHKQVTGNSTEKDN